MESGCLVEIDDSDVPRDLPRSIMKFRLCSESSARKSTGGIGWVGSSRFIVVPTPPVESLAEG
jgi:hypothetical protein